VCAVSAETVHRLQFAFTASFHYLFAHLSVGLALLILVFETLSLRTRETRHRDAARFWARIFALLFVFGVVTGIPLEFQFGANWERFSRKAGNVVAQTLAMETVFSFFLESAFLGLVLAGDRLFGPKGRWTATFLLFLGTWLSAYFIVATNAWMQHPVGHRIDADGRAELVSLRALLLNPWLGWQIAHTLVAAVVSGAFLVAAVGAFYLLSGRDAVHGRLFVKTGVVWGFVASVLTALPTGDAHSQMVAKHQPATLAAMEGLFRTQEGAPVVLIGQPDMDRLALDNPIELPRALSFLTYRRWDAEVRGLDAFPRDEWPTEIPLLYYAYHVMVGLGTIFIVSMAFCAWRLYRETLYGSRRLLWLLLVLAPFPWIANVAGWTTAELGRQPWTVHGIQRTSEAWSSNVSSGNALFTLIGFMGLYALLALVFVALLVKAVLRGPQAKGGH
jgi:cytochrome d ubiquinol oxidase subunit I